MSDHSRPPSGSEQSGYERRDIHVRSIAGFFVLLMVSMFACTIIGYILHTMYLNHMQRRPVQKPALANYKRTPPEPRLQVLPDIDLVSLRASEETLLTSYGWMDSGSGVVRIPLARAQELLAVRGLPARSRSTDR